MRPIAHRPSLAPTCKLLAGTHDPISTPHDPFAAGRLREAIQAYPRANAVLVRRHGVYVWGRDLGAR